MDITDTRDLGSLRAQFRAATVQFPDKCVKQKEVGQLAGNLSKDEMLKNLEKLTSFHTRYYKSDYGRQSSEWVLDKVNQIIKDAGASDTVTASPFAHSWPQSSVIARIPGKSNTTVVIGAHQDSINLWLPAILAAPGADDDGSGTVTILEVFRTLLGDKDVVGGSARNTVEFHWYSAEEAGLLGSQAIFQAYEKAGRDVKAMLQQDMTGYAQGTIDAGKPVSVGVITDYVDPGLTAFIKKVIEEVGRSKHIGPFFSIPPQIANIVYSTAASLGSRPSAAMLALTTPLPPRPVTLLPLLLSRHLRTRTSTSTALKT
jgi:leucyl aminopeptidase